MPRPDTDFPTDETLPVAVGKTPYVRFDRNDYSVPHTHMRRTLVVVASPDQVRVLDGTEIVARHRHRGLDRLRRAVPRSQLLYRLLAVRGGKLGSATRELLRLLGLYVPLVLDHAIAEGQLAWLGRSTSDSSVSSNGLNFAGKGMP